MNFFERHQQKKNFEQNENTLDKIEECIQHILADTPHVPPAEIVKHVSRQLLKLVDSIHGYIYMDFNTVPKHDFYYFLR